MIISKEREQRQQWLNSLKVGDEVVVNYGRRVIISEITRITPTRRFTVDKKGCVFGNDGVEMGKHRWGYTKSRMNPVTEEVKQAVIRDEAIQYINSYLRVENLTTQQLLDILKIIQQNE